MPESTQGAAPLRVENDRGVRRLILDNPPVNIIDGTLIRELFKAVAVAAEDPTCRVLVLQSANPDFFLAHFDVQSLLDSPPQIDPSATELNGFHRMCETLRTMPKPTIAMIDGRVGGGGGEIAASCDMRFGSPRTILNQMEVPLGILPGGSGTQRLPRLIGRGRAMEVVLGGVDIDAQTATDWGWLNRVIPADQLENFVDQLAVRIASFPADAVAKAKAAVLAASPDPTPGLRVEAQLFGELVTSDDAVTRMRHFMERGGQQPEAELRMGDFATELDELH